MRNKANSRPAELRLSTVWKEHYDKEHGPCLCENKANSRDRDCFGASLLAMTGWGEGAVVRNKANLAGPEWGNTKRGHRMRCTKAGRAKQSQFASTGSEPGSREIDDFTGLSRPGEAYCGCGGLVWSAVTSRTGEHAPGAVLLEEVPFRADG